MNNLILKVKKSYGGLPFSIYILFIARVINRMGGFVHAFLAMFLQQRMGMNDNAIANYIMIMGIMTSLSPFIGGRIADIRGRKTIYLVAQSMAAILLIPCGIFADSHPEVIPTLLIASAILSSIIRPINSAMVADLTDSMEQRKRAFALLYLGINVGVAIGPMIGGFLFKNYIKWFFIGDAITTLISVLLVAFFVKETQLTKKQMEEANGGEKMEEGSTLSVLLKKPVIIMFIFFSLFNSIAYAQGNFGLPLYLSKVFGEAGPMKFGALMSFNAVIVLICTIPITELLKRNRPVYNVSLASFLYAVGFGMTGLIGNIYPLFFVSVLIWTLGEIVAVTNHSVFIMSHTPVNYRGRFNGIIAFIMGAGHIVSPKIMSKLTMNFNYTLAWLFIGVLALVAAFGLIYTGKVDERLHPEVKGKTLVSASTIDKTLE
ncbi:MFS transporter [Clostridium sediminicola]|uniref:MFS transporter n=1 Tax=Clostridium sediminicola TaxID=3114879 RepID=UPI0031F26374